MWVAPFLNLRLSIKLANQKYKWIKLQQNGARPLKNCIRWPYGVRPATDKRPERNRAGHLSFLKGSLRGIISVCDYKRCPLRGRIQIRGIPLPLKPFGWPPFLEDSETLLLENSFPYTAFHWCLVSNDQQPSGFPIALRPSWKHSFFELECISNFT